MHANPTNLKFIDEEKQAMQAYIQAKLDHRLMLQQKAKLSWLKEGDSNSQIFYQSIKKRQIHNNIHAIADRHGKWGEG